MDKATHNQHTVDTQRSTHNQHTVDTQLHALSSCFSMIAICSACCSGASSCCTNKVAELAVITRYEKNIGLHAMSLPLMLVIHAICNH